MLFSIAIFLCAMPYLGPSGLLPTDVQPYAAVTAGLAILARPKLSLSAVPKTILPVAIISLFATASAFWLIFKGEGEIFNVLRSFWGYLSQLVILVFVWLYRSEVVSSEKVVRILDICMLLVLLGFFLQALGFQSLIQALTSRAIFTHEALSSRGFTSFHPEQSRVSEQMLLFGVMYLMLNALTIKRTFLIFVFSLISFAGQFFVSVLQVVFSLLLIGLIVIIAPRLRVRRSMLVVILFTFIALFGIFALLPEILGGATKLGAPDRFTAALKNLLQSPFALIEDKNAQIKFSGLIYALTAPIGAPGTFDILFSSRPEFIQNVVPVGEALLDFVFGVPLFQTERPYTAIGQWTIHFGLVGFIFALSFFVLVFRVVWKATVRRQQFNLLLAFFVLAQLLLLKLPLSHPTLWLVTGILIVTASSGTSSSEDFIARPTESTRCWPNDRLRRSGISSKRESSR